MLEQSLGILFYQKKPKNYVKGSISIYLRITVNGSRVELATHQSCEPERWNSHAQRAKGTTEASRSLNALLDTLERKVHDARRTLIESETSITAEAIKNVLTGKSERSYMLLDIFEQHNKQIAALIGKDFSPATVRKYGTTLDHVRSFLKEKYHLTDINIKSLTFSFATDLEFYLKTEKHCNHNSNLKHISNLRKIINHALKSGWLSKDPFFGYKMAKKEVVREYLSEAELQSLQRKEISIERLAQVRDIFVFSCYTGLAFIDVFQLTPSQIGTGVDGNPWIFTSRQKTDSPSRIPLLPPAQAILEKYKDHPKCICDGKVVPILSNQKMNAYLKELADICEIKKTLTFHIARHTFATTVTLSNGVPIETVSKMLGHKSIKITQHYAKIIDKKVSEDMLMLQGKLQSKQVPAA